VDKEQEERQGTSTALREEVKLTWSFDRTVGCVSVEKTILLAKG
jgi:hypothetical protein